MPRSAAVSSDDPERQLMIKTKICQRLLKEVAHYKDEVRANEIKLDAIKRDSSKDRYDIKRYEELLNESYIMVPDSSKRLQLSISDLSSYIKCNESLFDREGSWFQTAHIILQEHGQNATTNRCDQHDPPNAVTPVVETCVDDLADGEAF